MPTKHVRTTITLPADLLAATDRIIESGEARNRTEFVVQALREAVAAAERRAVDAAFQAMATDRDYQAEAEGIEREFSRADWEAWRIGEGRP